MKVVKKILKWVFYALIAKILLFISFIVLSLILTYITIDSDAKGPFNKEIYLSDNGIHVDLVIPENGKYIAYGWGSEIFYLNTPTWGELTVSNAYKALLTEPSSVMHVTTYTKIEKSWIKIEVNEKQLSNVKRLINKSFKLDNDRNRIGFEGVGYSHNDEFYKAVGRYSFFKTCNTWTNETLKKSNIKSCYWTPYSFGVVSNHKN